MDDWEVKCQEDVEKAKAFIKEQGFDECWSTDEVQKVFEITGFLAPFCGAIRREDGVKGALQFGDCPGRVYYNWLADER